MQQVIFSFIITFVGGQVRMKTGIEQKLTFGAKLLLRFGWPLIAWFFLVCETVIMNNGNELIRQSLYQTLVERAFQVALQDYLGRGRSSLVLSGRLLIVLAGFVTLWALNYVTIIGAGLALETMLSILGVPFLPVFLILWIICKLLFTVTHIEEQVADNAVNISKFTPNTSYTSRPVYPSQFRSGTR